MLDTKTGTSTQATAEGAEIVTVGRHGSKTAKTGRTHSVPVFTTKVYRAVRRQRDGALTWRLVSELSGHSTAGRGISGPMEARARDYASETGRPFVWGVLSNDICD